MKDLLAQANAEQGADVKVGAMLLDQEQVAVKYIWKKGTEYTQLCKGPCVDAVDEWNNVVYNITAEVFPGLPIDAYKRGEITQATGDSSDPGAYWESTLEGLWCGLGAGWGNDDVEPCTNTEYSLRSPPPGTGGWGSGLLDESLSMEMYSVGEIQIMRESFNRTANNAKARNTSAVTPWLWLGGGARRSFADNAGRQNDDAWNYEMIYSWMAGLELNDEYYGDNPYRFALWNMAKRIAFYPSIFGPLAMVKTPCGVCNVRLQHFVSSVYIPDRQFFCQHQNRFALAGNQPRHCLRYKLQIVYVMGANKKSSYPGPTGARHACTCFVSRNVLALPLTVSVQVRAWTKSSG
jgi:hypothetical protein